MTCLDPARDVRIIDLLSGLIGRIHRELGKDPPEQSRDVVRFEEKKRRESEGDLSSLGEV